MQATPEELFASAEEAHKTGRLQEAERLCRQILSENPRHVPATVLLGIVYAKAGRTAQGIQLLRAAIKLDPNSFESHVWLGTALRSTGNIGEGAHHLERAVSLRPDDAQALASLAQSYVLLREPERAVPLLQTAASLAPDVAVVFQALGDSLQQVAREEEAIEAYLHAVELNPGLPNSTISAARLLSGMGRRDEAAELADRVFKNTPDEPQSLLRLAQALIESDMHENALKAVKRSLELEPNLAPAYSILGTIYRQLGRFELAIPNLEKAIELQPTGTAAYLQLAYCRRMTPGDANLIERMALLLRDRNHTIEGRRFLHFALGKAYDDLGEYQKAMQHFDEGNGVTQIKTGSAPFDRALLKANIDMTIRTFTPEYIARHRELNHPSDKPVLIVGMIRSGTTLIEQIISSHPEVGAAGELTYLLKRWSKILQPTKGAPHREAAVDVANGYIQLLTGLRPGKARVTDKMPGNFMLAGMAHLLFPNARIIHSRRHPVDTCVSIYTTYFDEPVSFGQDKDTIVFFYEQYLRLMEHWRQVLPPDRFLEVDYEELVGNREEVTRRMMQFCGLEWDDACLFHERNDASIKTPSWWQARQPIYSTSVGRWRNYEPFLGDFKRLL